MLMPPISRFMTRQPWTISSRGSLAQARELMHEHSIRHLPVVDGDKLVGIVSDRDLHQPWLSTNMHVHDVMSDHVYAVRSDAGVDEVAETMSEHKYGAVVVVTGPGGVIGIFTSVDACRVLAEVLRRAAA